MVGGLPITFGTGDLITPQIRPADPANVGSICPDRSEQSAALSTADAVMFCGRRLASELGTTTFGQLWAALFLLE